MKVIQREDLEEEREDIYVAQELYVTLGILDREEDFFEFNLKLFGEAVVGFFDTEEEKLYVVQDTPEFGLSDILTYSHEYAHGLQQQHFDVHSTLEALKDGSGDASLAFRALIEGDAAVAETLYMITHMDEEQQTAVRQSASETVLDALNAAPHLIRRGFLLPYVEGLRFLVNLYLTPDLPTQGWASINRAYVEVPLSTEHILHVDKYVAREEPAVVELPGIAEALGVDWSELERNTMGEFFIMAYLEMGVPPPDAAAAATGWGRGQLRSFQGAPGPEPPVVAHHVGHRGRRRRVLRYFPRVHAGAGWPGVGDGRGSGRHPGDEAARPERPH